MYNIEVLAKLSGLTRRTVRYYIQIGLLTPPVGSCRGSYYTDGHLKRLEQIKNWASQGVPLSQMKAIISAENESINPEYECHPMISSWERCEIHEGVELNFKRSYFNNDDLNKIKRFITEVLHCRKESNCE